MRKCPTCSWTWLRSTCREGRDEEGKPYCFHADCKDGWHDATQEKDTE